MKLSNNGGEREVKHRGIEQCSHTLHGVKGCLYMCSRKSDRYVSVWTRISALSTSRNIPGGGVSVPRAGVSALGIWNKVPPRTSSSVPFDTCGLASWLSYGGPETPPWTGPESPPLCREQKFRPKSPGKFRPTPDRMRVW